MRMKKSLAIVTFLLIIASMTAIPSNASKGINAQEDRAGRKATITTDEITVEINAGGTIPFYHWNTSDEEIGRFFLRFLKIFEYKDTDNSDSYNNQSEKVPSGNLALPSVDWTFSEFEETESGVNFTFDGTGKQKEFEDFHISLVNHMSSDNLGRLKFDLIMSGWPFMESDHGLALEFNLQWNSNSLAAETNENGVFLSKDGETVTYFDFVSECSIFDSSTSTTRDGDVLPYYEANNNDITVYLSYPYFGDDEELTHDPAVAAVAATVITPESSGNPQTSEVPQTSTAPGPLNGSSGPPSGVIGSFLPPISKEGMVATTVVATLVVISLAMVQRKKRI